MRAVVFPGPKHRQLFRLPVGRVGLRSEPARDRSPRLDSANPKPSLMQKAVLGLSLGLALLGTGGTIPAQEAEPLELGSELGLEPWMPLSVPQHQPRSLWEPAQWIGPQGHLQQGLQRLAQGRLIPWPVVSQGWQQHPWGMGFRVAALSSDKLIHYPDAPDLKLEPDALGELFFHFKGSYPWNWELRWAWARPWVSSYAGARLPRADVIFFDLSARRPVLVSQHWRWSLVGGVGGATFSFADERGIARDQTLWQFPLGAALEYRWDDDLWVVVEFRDQIVLGAGHGLENMHLLSLSVGLEYRFGGSRTSYWPWDHR